MCDKWPQTVCNKVDAKEGHFKDPYKTDLEHLSDSLTDPSYQIADCPNLTMEIKGGKA
jgi:hypothetical protein